LDTGPLITYLALRFLDENPAGQKYRDEVFLQLRGPYFGESEQERFAQALAGRRLLTTAHVAVEVFNLRGRSKLEEKKEGFRQFSLGVLVEQVEEVECRLTEVNQQKQCVRILRDHGLTDSGLIIAAAKSKSLLLVDDSRFFAEVGAGSPFEICMLTEYLRSCS
jgi:hypothetical protein